MLHSFLNKKNLAKLHKILNRGSTIYGPRALEQRDFTYEMSFCMAIKNSMLASGGGYSIKHTYKTNGALLPLPSTSATTVGPTVQQ